MKLVNLNISIKIDNSDKVAEFLNTERADIVVLQEVIRHFEDRVFDQYKSKEKIEGLAGGPYPHKFFGPLWISDSIKHGKEMHRDFGGLVEQGNELLSRYSIVSATNEFFHKHYCYALDWSNWKEEDHGRAVSVVELESEGKRLQILNIHGIWTENKKGDDRTTKECQYVLGVALRKDLPTIIVGDFNLLPESEGIKILSKQFRNLITENNVTTTRPDFKDNLEIGNNAVDYIFVNDKIKVKDFRVMTSDISDHLPLVLEFELSGNANIIPEFGIK